MSYLFLEDGDLLEAVELENILEQELIDEATIAGMKITKENLEDEKFVNDLIEKIKTIKRPQDFIAMFLMVTGIISMLTVVGIPIGILLLAISSKITSGVKLAEKDLKKLDDCFEKTISKLKKKNPKNDSEKQELEKIIKKLEENRKSIYDTSQAQYIMSLVDMNKYDGYDIIVNNNVSIECEVAYLLSTRDDYLVLELKKKSLEDYLKKFTLKNCNYIEAYAANGITSEAQLLKVLSQDKYKLSDDIFEDYGMKVKTSLKNKNISTLVNTNSEVSILYCHDDKCCYYWIGDTNNSIEKFTVKQFLDASKQAYEDLVKVLEAVNKK